MGWHLYDQARRQPLQLAHVWGQRNLRAPCVARIWLVFQGLVNGMRPFF
jgi:hypothetical protein